MFQKEKFESFLLEKMSKTKIPSVAVSIIKDDEMVYSRGFGFKDIESGLPATPRTLYGIGSITKSFTALAIMQLEEKDLLSVEDPIDKYIPFSIEPFGEKVRIWHLLTHTSGIPSLAYAVAYIRGRLGLSECWLPLSTAEDILSFMSKCRDWVAAKPGEKFFYLNEGYALLGYIIEKVSGLKYEDYVKKNILEPLGMKRSFFGKDEVESDPDVATFYVVDKSGNHVPKKFPYGITSDGGLISNTIDMCHYLSMFINQGKYDGREIVSPDKIGEMEKPRIKVPYVLLGGETYGYGLIITPDIHGHKLVWHSGSVLVTTGFAGYIRDKKLGVVVLANSSGYSLSKLGVYALSLLLGRDPEKLDLFKREKVLDKLEGKYSTYKETMTVEVLCKGEFLTINIRDRLTAMEIILVPEKLEEDYALFYTLMNGYRMPVEFYIKDKEVVMFYERYRLVKKE